MHTKRSNLHRALRSLLAARTHDEVCRAAVYSGVLDPNAVAMAVADVDWTGQILLRGSHGFIDGHLLRTFTLSLHESPSLYGVLQSGDPLATTSQQDVREILRLPTDTNLPGTRWTFVALGVPETPSGLALLCMTDRSGSPDPSGSLVNGSMLLSLALRGIACTDSMPAPTGDARLTLLTDRQRRVVGLVSRGHTNAEIAQQLHLSVATVKAELTRIFAALRVNSRGSLIQLLRSQPGT